MTLKEDEKKESDEEILRDVEREMATSLRLSQPWVAEADTRPGQTQALLQ
jgi:hypothetical protein